MKNPNRMKFSEMADTITSIKEEVNRRNPIGVNFYLGYLEIAASALNEISSAEKSNRTVEYGLRE